MRDLYFGYGSNLDEVDWSEFCRVRGVDPGVLRPIGPAVLPDEILAFDYLSLRRQCGALDIRHHLGGRVDGGLFAVAIGGWAVLDAKEGHPHAYRRGPAVVIADGARVDVQTYRVIASRRFRAPDAFYLAACRRGRARFGLSDEQLDAALAAACRTLRQMDEGQNRRAAHSKMIGSNRTQ